MLISAKKKIKQDKGIEYRMGRENLARELSEGLLRRLCLCDCSCATATENTERKCERPGFLGHLGHKVVII